FPEGAAALILGTEVDGIWISKDGGKSFEEKNSGFSHRVLGGFVADGMDRAHLLVLTAGRSQELFESADAGKNWKKLAGVPAGITKLFSSGENRFAGLRSGGVARYDPETRKWKELRFVAGRGGRKTQKQNSRTAEVRERIVRTEVF